MPGRMQWRCFQEIEARSELAASNWIVSFLSSSFFFLAAPRAQGGGRPPSPGLGRCTCAGGASRALRIAYLREPASQSCSQ